MARQDDGGDQTAPSHRGPSRRGVLGAVLGAALPRLAQADPAATLDALHERARAQGRVTWYIAHISSEDAQALARLFEKTYPGVTASVVRATGQVIYEKLQSDIRVGAHNCDVFSSTDLGQYVTLRTRQLLLPYRPLAKDSLRAPFRDYDSTDLMQITDSKYTTLCHRTEVPAAEAPRRWTDLLDPKWAGRIAVAHPAYSGAMGTWVYEITKMYGWDFFQKLAANKPLVGRSLIDPVTTLISGERQVGIGPSDLIVDQAARGNPVAQSFADDGNVLAIGPSSIIRNAPNPDAAKLFIEFLLGPEAGQFAADHHRLPIPAALAPLPGVEAPAQTRIITPVAQELVKGIPDIIERWRDTFGV